MVTVYANDGDTLPFVPFNKDIFDMTVSADRAEIAAYLHRYSQVFDI